MKRIIIILLMLIGISGLLSSQSSPRNFKEARAMYDQAPDRVKYFFYVLDSLIDSGKDHWPNESWKLGEVKKYASILYDLYDYDPVIRILHLYDPVIISRYKYKRWLIDDRQIYMAAEERLPHYQCQLITAGYWIVVKVDSVTFVSKVETVAAGIEARVKKVSGTISKVWKGEQYQSRQEITAFYRDDWGDPGIIVGKEYLLVMYPLLDLKIGKVDGIWLQGSNLQESVFPIEGNVIYDRSNLFGMGERLDLNNFNKYLAAEIAKIKSWKLKTE